MTQGVGVVRHTKGSGLPGGRGVANGTPAGRCHYRWEEVIALLLALGDDPHRLGDTLLSRWHCPGAGRSSRLSLSAPKASHLPAV